ncbi:MAG TPA: isochorismatase family protein [Gaiellaceae bacterium]
MTAPRIEAGRAAALLLVDFARGWTDPASPLAVPCGVEVRAAARLLETARACRAPVVFTTVAYDEADLETVLMLRKTPRVRQMRTGSLLTEIDARLAPRDDELVLVKKHASAFFGTPLLPYLVARGVDTVLIGGVITSGCVRTSAVDAAQHGFRPLVVADATTDRSAEAREAALRTVDDLYGDVVSFAEAEEVLMRSGRRSPSA